MKRNEILLNLCASVLILGLCGNARASWFSGFFGPPPGEILGTHGNIIVFADALDGAFPRDLLTRQGNANSEVLFINVHGAETNRGMAMRPYRLNAGGVAVPAGPWRRISFRELRAAVQRARVTNPNMRMINLYSCYGSTNGLARSIARAEGLPTLGQAGCQNGLTGGFGNQNYSLHYPNGQALPVRPGAVLRLQQDGLRVLEINHLVDLTPGQLQNHWTGERVGLTSEQYRAIMEHRPAASWHQQGQGTPANSPRLLRRVAQSESAGLLGGIALSVAIHSADARFLGDPRYSDDPMRDFFDLSPYPIPPNALDRLTDAFRLPNRRRYGYQSGYGIGELPPLVPAPFRSPQPSGGFWIFRDGMMGRLVTGLSGSANTAPATNPGPPPANAPDPRTYQPTVGWGGW